MPYNRKRHFAIKKALEKKGKWDPKRSKISPEADQPPTAGPGQQTIPEGNGRQQVPTGIQGSEETQGEAGDRRKNTTDEPVWWRIHNGTCERLPSGYVPMRRIPHSQPDNPGSSGVHEQPRTIDSLCGPNILTAGSATLQTPKTNVQSTGEAIDPTDRTAGDGGTPGALVIRRGVTFYRYEINPTQLSLYDHDPANVSGCTEADYYSILNPLTLNSWLGCIFTCSPVQLIYEVMPFVTSKAGHVIATHETSTKNKAAHYHLLCSTAQRPDNFFRSYAAKFPTHGCCKAEKVKSLPGLLRYICKDPEHVVSNNNDLLRAATIATYANAVQWQAEPQWNHMTKDITDAIKLTNSTTLQELLNRAPTVTAKYLHRSNLQTVFQNCKLWMLNQNRRTNLLDKIPIRPADNRKIHGLLRKQKIDPFDFDEAFHSWATLSSDKKNTLILHGPSNTGKTSFIRPLVQLYNYGEAHNENIFSFTGCAGRDVILWEEPILTTANVDLCKLIFEGSSANIPHKFKDPIQTDRTPIVVTTNKHVWHFVDNEAAAIKNRSFIFKFSTCHNSVPEDRRQNRSSGEQPPDDSKNSGRGAEGSRSPSLRCRSPIDWNSVDSGSLIQSADYLIDIAERELIGRDDLGRSSSEPIENISNTDDSRPASSVSTADYAGGLFEYRSWTIGSVGAISFARCTTPEPGCSGGCMGRVDAGPRTGRPAERSRSRSPVRPVHGNGRTGLTAEIPTRGDTTTAGIETPELLVHVQRELEPEADEEPDLDRAPTTYEWLKYLNYIREKYERDIH